MSRVRIPSPAPKKPENKPSGRSHSGSPHPSESSASKSTLRDVGHLRRDRCLPRLRRAVAAFALFAGSAAADNTPPQLVSFSISPVAVDTSAGPATLNVSITAQDISNGFGSNAAGNGSISLALQSGNTV